ncbi:GAP family protein [Arthrobacter sp. MSA 4-2]|uniref:GAP family protein n=1 Tax=Arthrobacter sp. MSA 4-2 TaxID=2794349 RepID=UPI0018E7F278|nr:GAP family protein [Arthrobacter sp. MSA 4-2]MBJ2119798.1 GAP family protein [Arthrobacter sp. MSA 4-2]
MVEAEDGPELSGGLLAAIAGLAIADSFNPVTIVAITLILLTVRMRPLASAITFVLGAMSTVAVLGAVIFLGADAAAGMVGDGLVWLRRIVFLIAAAALFTAGIRRFKDRSRKGVNLPSWFGVGTAFPLGVLMTGADLPNAFPYFIAIERLIDADTGLTAGLLVLAGYSIVYCIPCLILLALGLAHGGKVRARLQSVYDRFSTGTLKRSIPAALALLLLATGVLAIALWP